jgi:DNA repair protein SbcC/Rad50
MILLKSLTIKNFLSHSDTEIIFKDNQKILIDGKSGSGKSAITDSILWCLYGEGRSESRSLVRNGAKECIVSLCLYEDKNETIITRSVSSSGKHNLNVTQNTGDDGKFVSIKKTGLKDTQEWIEKDFLRASYQLFTNSIAYPQENENSFVKANAAKRKELLLEIIQAENFDSLYDKAKNKLNSNKLLVESLSTRYSELERRLILNKEISKGLEESEKILKSISEELDKSREIERSLNIKVSSISNLSSEIITKENNRKLLLLSKASILSNIGLNNDKINNFNLIDINKVNKDIEKSEELKVKAKSIEVEIANVIKNQQLINSFLSNRPIIFDYTKEIDQINKQLIPLVQENSKCPSGDLCPFTAPIRGQIEFLSEQIQNKKEKSDKEAEAYKIWEAEYNKIPKLSTDINELYEKLRVLNEHIKELSNSYEVLKFYNDFKENKLDSINKENTDLLNQAKEIDNQILNTESEIELKKKELYELDANSVQIALIEVKGIISKYEESKNKALYDKISAENALKDCIDIEEQISKLSKEINKIKSEEEPISLLKESLSPRGVKAVIIDYLVPQLEERINSILTQMSDFRIRLDTQKQKASDDGSKEGLFITVINDRNEELSFSNYSGGEKIKITIAIAEALSSLMSSIGFRLMDENIISLDRDSTEGFVAVLDKLQDKFKQLLIISHIQEVKDMFRESVEIIKINGISKINELR